MTTTKNPPATAFGTFDLDALGDAGSNILSERLRDSLASASFGVWQPTVEQAVVEKGSEGHQPQPRRWDFGRPKRKPSPAREQVPQVKPDVDTRPHTAAAPTTRTAMAATTATAPTASGAPTPVRPTVQPAARRGRRRDEHVDAAGLPEVLTVDEVAVLLRVDRKTAYSMIARNEIPGARRVGRAIRVSRDAVVDWMRQGDVVRGRRKP